MTSQPTIKLSQSNQRGRVNESEDEGHGFHFSRNIDENFMEEMYKELQTTDEEGESPNVLSLNHSRKNSLNESINEYQKCIDSLDFPKMKKKHGVLPALS